MDLLKTTGFDKSTCPFDVLPLEEKSNKAKMELVRASARLLVVEGRIQIFQAGKVIDPSTAKGPIRIKMVRKG